MQTRTLVVLTALVAGMSLTSLLLLLLEPTPMAPPAGPMLLQQDLADEQRLLATDAPIRDWSAIVIHDSGASQGSADSLGRLHEQMGRQGLGYHFVINNGSGRADGTIEIGYRWKHQHDGAYLSPIQEDPEQAQIWHERVLGICLVGDTETLQISEDQFESLVWLIRSLQDELGVESDRVLFDLGRDGSPRYSFEERLRQRLRSNS